MQLGFGLTLGLQVGGTPPDPSVPVISSVTIDGTPTVGVPVGVIVSRTGYPPPTYTYVWKLDGTPIGGATGATYTPVEGDVGGDLSCTVTATNSEGSAMATSASVSVSAPTVLTATGVKSASEVGTATAWVTDLFATGVESSSEVGTATISTLLLTATGVESASEVGTATIANIAPAMSGVSYDGTDTISMNLSEPATIYWMVDDNATRSAAQVEAGGGEASGSFEVETGANSDDINLSSVSAGDHYLHLVAKDADDSYSTVSSTEYTFSEPTTITATGAQSASEVGAGTVWITALTATGAESTSEVGTVVFVSDGWAFAGAVVTNIPGPDEGWVFEGEVVTRIPAAA